MNVFTQLKIIHWNANGIQAEKADSSLFLHLSDIDITLLSETQ